MSYVTIGKTFDVRRERLFDMITSKSLLEFGLDSKGNFLDKEIVKVFYNNDKELKTQMKVTSYIENQVYSFKTLIGTEHITSTYIFLDRGDKTKLIYKEEITSKKAVDKVNNKFVTFIIKRKLKKKIKNSFRQIKNHLGV